MENQSKIPEAIVPTIIQPGEVRNPKGYPPGQKNARTIVKEFMNKEIETLQGTRVSRFQYLLWSMYEINFGLMKQIEYRKGNIKKAEIYLKEAQENLDEFLASDKIEETNTFNRLDNKLIKRERELITRNKEYENLMMKVQESQGKLSEHLQKLSGQYLEKKQIEDISRQPLHITCDKEDLDQALSEIDDES